MLEQIDTIEDIRMMFDHTIIQYKGDPVYVESILPAGKREYKAECYFIATGQRLMLPFNEKDFNLKPVRTGYVNLKGFALFLCRQPYRKYKQGLHVENIKTAERMDLGDVDQYTVTRFRHSHELVQTLRTKELYNTFKNIYPSLSDAIEQFEDGAHSVAFDRQFAVDKFFRIHFKGQVVGKVHHKSHKISFSKENSHLAFALRKDYEV